MASNRARWPCKPNVNRPSTGLTTGAERTCCHLAFRVEGGTRMTAAIVARDAGGTICGRHQRRRRVEPRCSPKQALKDLHRTETPDTISNCSGRTPLMLTYACLRTRRPKGKTCRSDKQREKAPAWLSGYFRNSTRRVREPLAVSQGVRNPVRRIPCAV